MKNRTLRRRTSPRCSRESQEPVVISINNKFEMHENEVLSRALDVSSGFFELYSDFDYITKPRV